jgi:hypothetical protein
MAYDPAEDRAARLERLRRDRDRELGNLRGQMKAAAASGRPATSLSAQAIRRTLAEVGRLTRELEREGG